jgi:hypothetical protein
MKILTSILCMYFGLLMAQPFVNMELGLPNKPNSCHPGKCCKEMEHKGSSDKQQSNTCNRDFCNPFVPCGTSLVYVVPSHNFASPVQVVPEKLKPVINENIISNYLSDCWRPPELLS